jgi:serine/threonine-protein kinase
VRRRWPQSIISWSRVLRGRFRDPLVGRDILIGGLLGTSFAILQHLDDFAIFFTPIALANPTEVDWPSLTSLPFATGLVLDDTIHSLMRVMEGTFVLLLLRIVLRNIWLTGAAFVLLIGLMEGVPASEVPILSWTQVILIVSVILFVIVRYGLVATAVGFYIGDVLERAVLPDSLSAWYAPQGLLPLVAVLALLLYGFHIALAGQPALAFGKLLEE